MSNAHRRKKNPDQVRQDLIESAIKLAIEGGLNAVSVQTVATCAGVTKGGFFHHFVNKQALLDAVFNWFLEEIDNGIDALMAADGFTEGSFTRAYVRTLFMEDSGPQYKKWAPLWISTLTDPGMKAKWAAWFEARVDRHMATDPGAKLEAVRFAIDGLWLAELSGVSIRDRDGVRDLLISSTFPPDPQALTHSK